MPEERGSENATTRFSIIFSARNEDVYVLRLDLPHKGEIKFHINMHEIVRDKVLPMAYPMSNEEFAQTIKPIPEGLFGKLFFRLNGQIWFRSKFEQKLAEVEWDRKEEIETIFHERSHMVIDAGIENDNRFIEFTNEFQAYITYFGLRSNNYISFGRDDIDYVNEVKKIRITNKYKSKVIECMKECGDAPIDSKKILWNLLGICGAENLIEKNAFYEMNMFERWKFVDEFVII